MSRSGTLLCVFLLLGICMGIVTATAREPERDNKEKLFGTDLHWWMLPRWRYHKFPLLPKFHPKYPSIPPPTQPPHTPLSPAPSPVDNAVSPPHRVPSPSPIDNAVSPTHTPPSPSPTDNKVSPTHTAPSPSPVDNNVPPPHRAPSPSPIDNKVSPTHTHPAPSPSPTDNEGSPTHTTPSPSPVVVLPPHTAPSLPPSPSSAPTPAVDCPMAQIKVNGCVSGLLASFFKDEGPLSTECCNIISRISDECFYRAFTYFKAPFFLKKVRHACSPQQIEG